MGADGSVDRALLKRLKVRLGHTQGARALPCAQQQGGGEHGAGGRLGHRAGCMAQAGVRLLLGEGGHRLHNFASERGRCELVRRVPQKAWCDQCVLQRVRRVGRRPPWGECARAWWWASGAGLQSPSVSRTLATASCRGGVCCVCACCMR